MTLHPAARVVGVTRSDATHAELRDMGVEPHATSAADGRPLPLRLPQHGFRNVACTVPPSGGAPADYAEVVGQALGYWDSASGIDGSGMFVMTSSGGIYEEDQGGFVDERSTVSRSPRALTLLAAENATLEAQGAVLRLAGLYDLERGAHAYWLKSGEVRGSPEGSINLVYYGDAADAVVAAILAGPQVRGSVFLVGDGEPMSRREIIQAAKGVPQFADSRMPVFRPPAGGPAPWARTGKVYDVRRARQELGWRPNHASFARFMSLQS